MNDLQFTLVCRGIGDYVFPALENPNHRSLDAVRRKREERLSSSVPFSIDSKKY